MGPGGCRTIGAFAGLMFAVIGLANASTADWKFYGGVSSPNGRSWCFYDATAIVREPDGHVRISTKCLPQTGMESIDIQNDFGGRIAKGAAKRRHDHYRPPYSTAVTVSAAEIRDVIRSEEIANIAAIAPRVKISYELKCTEKQARELSLYVQINGKVREVDKPGEWKDISPEANTNRLFKMLCPG